MGKIEIRTIASSQDGVAQFGFESLLRSMRISKVGDNYHFSLGETEINISADLMRDLIENAFMMLDYEDQKDLISVFLRAMR